ncbi:peptide ABC transporter permease [Pullulanibacillus camelliae]|uniref:Peptide ABC transporter permease n=1 Tax=Pullulanibacillus camelliae TaxID=1707096 RepID=A0A8J2YDS3_9BACL|nr:ABC transporter permease [Pullulanibacillus camelliae]GGE27012.1 peptide ABC transporter permease [Pullulanibacillus camelliae]
MIKPNIETPQLGERNTALPLREKRLKFWKRDWFQMLPFSVIIVIFVIVALAPGWIANHNPNLTDLAIRLKNPGFHNATGTYLLGTDELGRDVFSRVMYGARVSLLVSLCSVGVSGIIGGLLGIIAGYYGRIVETIIMRLADMVLSIPFLLLAILTVAVLGPSLFNLIVVLGLVRWPRYARVAQGKTLATVNQDFVKGVIALGAKSGRVIIRHIIPEVIPPLIVIGTIEVGLMIIYEASLSFIGLGVQPPTASWGTMLSEGQQYLTQAWWLASFPGLAIFLIVVSINMFGDYIRDRLDPKSKRR